MLRVLQVGLGPLGCRVVEDLYARRLGLVIAAVDHDPKLAGRPLAEVIPAVRDGPRIARNLAEVSEWSEVRCALVTTVSDLELCMEVFRELLLRGVAVVSTCEELAWPWLRHPVLAQELHELAVRHGGRILGTGVNPGFLMDALPVAATTACRRVDAVRVERIQDASLRRVPFQAKIGVGLDDAAFKERVAEGSLRHVGLGESLFFLAHHLGFEIEHWEETIDPVVAEAELESGLGKVPAGVARGVHQEARAWVKGETGSEPRLELVFRAALAEPDPCDRIVVQGEPPLTLEIPGGVHGDVATSAIALNSIRPLLAAAPGLHTMASLPLQGCAAPDDFAPPIRAALASVDATIPQVRPADSGVSSGNDPA